MEIKGKTAVITGGGTGIGRAIALDLAKKGANVAIVYSRSVEDAEKTANDVRAHGVRAEIYQTDVSNNEQVKNMAKQVLSDFNSVDILVNNAGTTNYVDLDDLDGMLEEYWDRAFSINVKGMFFVSRAFAEELRKQKGCIVNITSIAGINGMGSSMAYAASKAAGISVTKSLARVLAPDVRVNSIAPGIVMTRWVEGREDHVRNIGSGSLLGRVAYPEDVSNMAIGLIEGGDFVTGQTIIVDGGKTIV